MRVSAGLHRLQTPETGRLCTLFSRGFQYRIGITHTTSVTRFKVDQLRTTTGKSDDRRCFDPPLPDYDRRGFRFAITFNVQPSLAQRSSGWRTARVVYR